MLINTRGTQSKPDPSPQEIRAQAARIRSRWTAAERKRRQIAPIELVRILEVRAEPRRKGFAVDF